jgi:hypothetical protein
MDGFNRTERRITATIGAGFGNDLVGGLGDRRRGGAGHRKNDKKEADQKRSLFHTGENPAMRLAGGTMIRNGKPAIPIRWWRAAWN